MDFLLDHQACIEASDGSDRIRVHILKQKIIYIIAVSLWLFLFSFQNHPLAGKASDPTSHKIALQGQTTASERTSRAQNGSLTPAQEYAGEVLSYLLFVVLGQEGPVESRRDWQTRGLCERLDFRNIVEVMTDREKNQLDVMVLDFNLLALTRVLYYYDNRLSLYKGDYDVASIYPAPEFVALRLLLLQRIHRGEKVDLKTLIEHEGLLLDKSVKASPRDLEVMKLRPDELALLRDLLEKEPHIYHYLMCPFIVKAFNHVGAITGGEFEDKKIRDANYRNCHCRCFCGSERIDAVKILFLPSMMKEFYYGDMHKGLSRHGFKPTEFFKETTEKLRMEIYAAAKDRLEKEIVKQRRDRSQTGGPDRNGLTDQIARENISFYIEDERPLVIYPGNAEQVIKEVCPEADFTVVILGANVYRSIYFDRARDVYPHVNRLYVDIMDVSHSDIQGEVEGISKFICSRLKDRLRRVVSELSLQGDRKQKEEGMSYKGAGRAKLEKRKPVFKGR